MQEKLKGARLAVPHKDNKKLLMLTTRVARLNVLN